MAINADMYCPVCDKPVERSAWQCAYCGANVAWALEERRLVKEYLRYTGFALIGSGLLGMAILTLLGLMTRLPGLTVSLVVASVALGAAAWLSAGNIDVISSSRRRNRRPKQVRQNIEPKGR